MNKVVLILSILFWTVVILIVQSYFLYPLVLRILTSVNSGFRSRTVNELPTVSLVIAAYNEEEIIEEKLHNSLELNYPNEKLEIIVFSDASNDATDEIVQEFDKVILQRIEGRLGKTVCQNRVVNEVESDIIVFSDANSMYDPDAVRQLVKNFDDGVSCVVGELRYQEGDVSGESFYWRYEQLLKKLESRFHSLVTGNGAIYAVRRASYVPLSADAISDFAEPLAIVRNGETVKYAENAVAWERTGKTTASEFDRRKRIIRRSWNTFLSNRDLINPLRYPKFSFELLSHKLLRWLTPFFLVLLVFINILLVIMTYSSLYIGLLILQSIFYSLATIGWFTDRMQLSSPFFIHIPFYFLLSNLAMASGLVELLKEGTQITWETDSR